VIEASVLASAGAFRVISSARMTKKARMRFALSPFNMPIKA
jgi:hypothetical protein